MDSKQAIKILKTLALTAIIFAGLLVIFNYNYFWQNIRYDLYGVKQAAFPAAPVPSAAGAHSYILAVPSLGISAPVIYATATGETAFQAALKNGVAHYPGTADPGQTGNCYIFGHSSDYIWSSGHYKNVFAILPKIKKGADIIISGRQNQYTYTVTDSRMVSPGDLSVLSQQTGQKKILTLQTSYPIGTALARWIVVAEVSR
ncbi:MAG: sortase [Candidatus Doudnabacteria bacterium]|nr:sortase [Candidatus Doudnabacteria bacterium]